MIPLAANPSDTEETATVKGNDIKKTWVRWLMLFMACNFLIGSYYCYDNPGVLEQQIEDIFDIDAT